MSLNVNFTKFFANRALFICTSPLRWSR